MTDTTMTTDHVVCLLLIGLAAALSLNAFGSFNGLQFGESYVFRRCE